MDLSTPAALEYILQEYESQAQQLEDPFLQALLSTSPDTPQGSPSSFTDIWDVRPSSRDTFDEFSARDADVGNMTVATR
eukprot:CAMPEP_0119320028 /NCGR_PEP_ID=MMETSP1333-20130426/51201_1 /TAXON_ID=418940 /ORGANISM="Scyphosphaera apsteinii, Strain RCC1455" /LENGTH=78 /DNA_ID=CAMNT_0007326621 /DNA_START=85 /DNA_END=318 /DNA_ORIENTATION=+